MGLFSRKKPKIKIQTTKKDGFSGWVKCSGCSELIHANEIQINFHCCPKCNYHYRLNSKQRIALLVDEESFEEYFENIQPTDALNFEDTEKYTDRLKSAKEKSNVDEAVVVGVGKIKERNVALGVLDFSFMGGSMGSVVGERLTKLIELSLKKKYPLIIVSASGGARMQESILSLMQMAKTASALAKLHDAKIPYISVLTNPTMGGVTASFAALGDVILAEPDALIGFAGPRVVEQITKQKLPKTAQKSEFLLEHGFIDCIFKRSELKEKISILLAYLSSSVLKNIEEKDRVNLKKLVKLSERQEKALSETKTISSNSNRK